ncbi:hypothetical protein [Massilia sp.]|uniref:hypothetical protein n=1 Tax=Massilia sp. TaxID=1882437 RepID=UPI00289D29FE|nr:hypothetical protein [Massilia sp.]
MMILYINPIVGGFAAFCEGHPPNGHRDSNRMFRKLELIVAFARAHCFVLVSANVRTFLENMMSKVQQQQQPKPSTTVRDAARVQAAAAKASGGTVSKGSQSARMQAAAARNGTKSGAK